MANKADSLVIKQVKYIGSFVDQNKLPQTRYPEFAFIGRSNVGKSSLINAICTRKDLAKVSKQPGKTQTINLFEVDQIWYLVDLPGYGYAKHSKKTRIRWDKMIRNYLLYSRQLVVTFVLLDINIPPQKIDLEFINWLGENQLPFAIVYTKNDKSKKHQIELQKKVFQDALSEFWDPLPPQFFTSSLNKKGIPEIVAFIGQYANLGSNEE